MARLSQLPESLVNHIKKLPCPTFDDDHWVPGPAVKERRVALISSAGLQRRSDSRFGVGDADYRVIPGDVSGNDLVLSHISTNFDRTGFQQDLNVVFPIDRLKELAAAGEIGAVADFHYSFMGATAPEKMADHVPGLAKTMLAEDVNAVVLLPV